MSENNAMGRKPGASYYLGWLIAVVAVAVVVVAMTLARRNNLVHASQDLDQRAARGRRVLVQPVLHAPAQSNLDLPATVHGYIETQVYAKVAGYLKSIKVDKGDRIKKGQVLAELDSPELDQQVAQAKAGYDVDVMNDRRYQQLAKEGVAAQQQADDVHAQMLAAKAAYDQTLALEAYKVIRAPFDGVVTERHVDPGALIPQATGTTGGTPILSLSTLKPLRVYSQAPQEVAPFLKDNDPANVTVSDYPGRNFAGKIARHPEALDPATRTMLVEIDLPNNDGALLPGMYAHVAFEVHAPEKALLVPDDSLVYRDGKPLVPVVRDNKLRLVPVQLGRDTGASVEVSGDITAQDMIALSVGQAARDGEVVQPVTAK
jgi:RND family efflux transporter MFP subunit